MQIERLLILIALVIAFSSCNNKGSKNADDTSNVESTDEKNILQDTLDKSTQSIQADSNVLSYEGSNLNAETSNLNTEVQLSSDQLFDFDKSTLKSEAEEALKALATDLTKLGEGAIRITGYTDSKGDDNYNKKLSLDRANAVKNWLAKYGLKNELITEGKGEDDPIAPNTTNDGKDNEEGRQKNRRVEVKYLGNQSISK